VRKSKIPPGVPEPVLQGSERSALFWLLYQHHGTLLEKWNGRRVDWNLVSAWAAAQQAWDRNGQTPHPNTARKTWQRVRALVEREKTEREAKRRPSLNPTPRQTLPPPVAAPTRAKVPETPQSDAEERMALMQARINQRSGRLA